jgi:SAM-dependent methyltransferase
MTLSAPNYKHFWNDKATTYTGALIAVDGSSDEAAVLATGEHSASQVKAALALKTSDRVLEIGCGVARIGLPLAPEVGFWQGVDISENMVGVAKQRLSAHSNVAAEAIPKPKLPFPDASFDAVYSIAVFIHMDKEDFYLYLKEAARVLKPGGRLYFDHWNLTHAVGFRRFWYEANFYEKAGDPSVRKDVARNQFSSPDEIRAYLQNVGLIETAIMGDTPWVQACAMKLDPAQDGTQVQRERERIQSAYDVINYGQAWTRYFDWVLPVVFEGTHPKEILAKLTHEPDTHIRRMYETWLLAAWRNDEKVYGPAPKP